MKSATKFSIIIKLSKYLHQNSEYIIQQYVGLLSCNISMLELTVSWSFSVLTGTRGGTSLTVPLNTRMALIFGLSREPLMKSTRNEPSNAESSCWRRSNFNPGLLRSHSEVPANWGRMGQTELGRRARPNSSQSPFIPRLRVTNLVTKYNYTAQSIITFIIKANLHPQHSFGYRKRNDFVVRNAFPHHRINV